MNVTNNNNFTFGSGLNIKIRIHERLINSQIVENNFADRYGIEASFIQNKSAALANKFCADIFEKLGKLICLKFVLPPCITVFERKDLVDKNSALNFCIPDTKEVLKNDYPFFGRSVFFQNFKNLNEIDDITDYQYKNKRTSSSHFLSPFIHEWLHSIHIDRIYNKFGYGGSCEYLNEKYPRKSLNKSGFEMIKELQNKKMTMQENEIIYNELGEYATLPNNQYLEVFSEAFTKFICDSLKGVELIKNPIELLKSTPKEFQKILRKATFPTSSDRI